MVLTSFNADALHGLRSKDQLELLDSIDRLRSLGINHFVSLPQIIVCGDQSSGKSSVLESISGVSFPIRSSLCTRFPTELVLRQALHSGITVSIVPHRSRSESEKLSLASFHEGLDGFEGLPVLIEKAKAAMGISTNGKAFSKDLLRVEVSGPDRPHLTIVDLPGLIHSETKQQSSFDVELIQDVVQAYMNEPRSVILAVVSAKNDYANQIVLRLARKADPDGSRTLGVITKPDTLTPGSGSEATYKDLAKNQDVRFRLGWHVLKNMDTETGTWSLADRDARETEFFSRGVWKTLPQSLLGIDQLRNRLSRVLLHQIAEELPGLVDEIEINATSCRQKLQKLGEPRTSQSDQRLYLVYASQAFQSLVKAAVDGTYNDPFFGDANSERGYQTRLRAVLQSLNSDFAERLTRHGHRLEIPDFVGEELVSAGMPCSSREKFIDHVQQLMQRTRGRELPGTFSPMIVADLFYEQSKPWGEIARSHIGKVWKAVDEFLHHVTTHVADDATSRALAQELLQPVLNELLIAVIEKTAEFLVSCPEGHPITYNQDFTEIVQRIREERRRRDFSRILGEFFGTNALDLAHISSNHGDLRGLVTALVKDTEPDMSRVAASEAVDCMKAYYKVALKRVIDNVAVEVIETKLVSALRNILSPVAVSKMPDDLVRRIAGESEGTRAQREQLKNQLEVLKTGLATCKRVAGIKLQDADTNPTRPSSSCSVERPGSGNFGRECASQLSGWITPEPELEPEAAPEAAPEYEPKPDYAEVDTAAVPSLSNKKQKSKRMRMRAQLEPPEVL